MYPNEYCHQCDPELPPIEVPPPPVCVGEECQEIYPGTCVKYTGPAISCLNIAANESLNSVIQKIAARLCSCCNGGAPVNCVVSEWSPWSECIAGMQSRTRTIITPPSNGGAACPPLYEERACLEACTELFQVEIASDSCESVTVSFIDDGSGDHFTVYLLQADGTSVDAVNIQGTGTLDNYSHTFGSVPAGIYFAKIEKFCTGMEYPVSAVTTQVTVTQCIPPCDNPPYSVEVIDCETVEITLNTAVTVPVYGIEYKPSNVDVWTVAASNYDAGFSGAVFTISNLTEGIAHTFRVRHWCDEGNVSLWADTIVVLPSCPVQSCSRPTFTAVAATCDQIEVTLDATSTTPVYDVEYRVQNGTWQTGANALDATVQDVILLSSLVAGQVYEVRVRRVCSQTLVSDWVTALIDLPACVTPCTDPVWSVTNISCTEVQVNTVSLTSGTSIEVQYKESTATTWSASLFSLTGTVNITGLLEDTLYDIRVRKVCGNDTFSNWTTDTFTTGVCLVTKCYEVFVGAQEGLDVGTYYVKVTDGNGTVDYQLIDGYTYNIGAAGFVKNVCSSTIPELVTDTNGTPAPVDTLTYNETGVCTGGCDTTVVFTSFNSASGSSCLIACDLYNNDPTPVYAVTNTVGVGTVIYTSSNNISGTGYLSMGNPLTGVAYVVIDGVCYTMDSDLGTITASNGPCTTP